MLVRDCMTRNPICVHPESDPLAAIALCKSARIRRLPVIDAEGHIVGIVSRNDLELFLVQSALAGRHEAPAQHRAGHGDLGGHRFA